VWSFFFYLLTVPSANLPCPRHRVMWHYCCGMLVPGLWICVPLKGIHHNIARSQGQRRQTCLLIGRATGN
jgi:hypothetical protein